METTIRLYNPLPRFVLGLNVGMGDYAQRVCEAPAKREYSTSGKMTMEKRLYRLPEAAVYMGIPKGSLYKMAWQKRLPFVVRCGRLLLFDKRGIDNWIAENTQQTE